MAFWINLCMGIFASSLLILINSYITYFSEKRKYIVGFYLDCNKAINSILSWGPRLQISMDTFTLGEVNKSIDTICTNVTIVSDEFYREYVPFFKQSQESKKITKILKDLIEVENAMSKAIELLYNMEKNKENKELLKNLLNEYSDLSDLLFYNNLYKKIEEDKAVLEKLVKNNKNQK